MSALDYNESSSSNPFLLSSLGNLVSDVDVCGDRLDVDKLGSARTSEREERSLYFDSSLHTVGVVCGNSKSASNLVMKRIIGSHLRHPDARVLILHTDNEAPHPTACTLASDFAGRGCKTYVSPRRPRSASQRYPTSDMPGGEFVKPLAFKEADISIKHVLEFFAPDPYTSDSTNQSDRSRTLSTIIHILNQLSEPFDLVRFNELVGEEKWDEEGETHIAIRQTLLTSLISALPDENGAEFDDVTLVDLTDPILHATRVDSVLMDMVLSSFLSQMAGNPKLIVLSNSHEYIRSSGCFERSIAHISSDKDTKRTSLLLSTPFLGSISEEVWNTVDYVACTGVASPAWGETLRRHLSSQEKPSLFDIRLFNPGSICIIPAREFRAPRGYGESSRWCIITAHELNRTMSLLPIRAMKTTAEVEKGQKKTFTAFTWPQFAWPFVPGRSDSPSPAQQTTRSPFAAPTSLTSPSYSDDIHSPSLPHTTSPSTSTNQQTALDLSYYSSEFRPLISAIYDVSGGQTDIWVGYVPIRDKVGNNHRVKALGWSTFTSWVKAAVTKGYIFHVGTHGEDGLLLLKQPPAPQEEIAEPVHEDQTPPASPAVFSIPGRSPSPPPSLSTGSPKAPLDNQNLLSPLSLDLNAFPTPFRPLISAILKLSGGRRDVLVDYLELRTEVGNNRVVKAMGWGSFTQLIREAVTAGYVDHLVRKGFDRVRLRTDPFAGPGWNGTTGLSNAQATKLPPPIPIDPTWYPSNFQKLMAVVVSLSRGVIHAPVSFEDVRALIGKKAEVKKMGWVTLTSWVDAARDKGYIRTGGVESKWIMLLPFNRNA